MAKRKTPPARTRLYVDVPRDLYWNIPLTIGNKTIAVPLKASALRGAQRGYPWECWLACAIMDYAKQNPDAFPHPVLYAYVTTSAIFLIDKIKGQPTHAVKYQHNFGPYIKKFDTLSRRAFLRWINGNSDLSLTIKPGRARRVGVTRDGGTGKHTGGPRTKTISHGAKRRAIMAGLIPPDHGKQTVEQVYA
jgi:hypothetical protein